MHHSWSRTLPPWTECIVDHYNGNDPHVLVANKSALPGPRLHAEVMALMRWLSPTEHETHLRLSVISDVTAFIAKHDPLACVDLFGSFSYGVGLPQSDLDVNVTTDVVIDVDTLHTLLRATKQFYNFHVVRKARVPVVKCTHRDSGIDVDITLNNPSGRITGCAAKQLLDRFPAARPLVMVAKYYLRQRGLSEVHRGGLSSYALCAMAVSFLQHRQPKKHVTGYGQLLVEFFHLYAFEFNYKAVAIDVANEQYIVKPPPYKAHHPPHLLHVVDPADSANNVSSSSKKILFVKGAFEHAYHCLTAVLPPKVDIYQTLLGRILHHDVHIRALRRYMSQCPGSAFRVDTILRQIDPTPFLPESRPKFLQSPTLTFAVASVVVKRRSSKERVFDSFDDNENNNNNNGVVKRHSRKRGAIHQDEH